MDQESSAQGGDEREARSRGKDEKFCESCGRIIPLKAVKCPECEAHIGREVNKTALLVLTFFLGGIGGHKFYLGKNWQGFFYILFCWTSVPALIALVEFFIYIFTSPEKLNEKYKASSPGTVVAMIAAGGIVMTFGFIIAAIAIPMYVANTNRAYQAAVEVELKKLSVAEENYFLENNRYSDKLSDLNHVVSNPKVSIEIISAGDACYQAVGTHEKITVPVIMDCSGIPYSE